MILDQHRKTPGFPFADFHQSIEQYVAAQTYWMAVLRHAVGFDDTDWHPMTRPVDLADDMYTGLITQLQSRTQPKQIFLQTFSLPASINMLIVENGPTPAKDIPDFVLETMDDDAKAAMLNGTPEATLRAEAQEHYKPFMAWVERAETWIDQPGHADGGFLKPVERLILNSEVSEACEPLALQAIESFIAKGSALVRVNTVFAPEIDG